MTTCNIMFPCRPASLHTREGQPALWEFPRDHWREGRPRHHYRQLWSLPAHSQLRLRFHHQRQRSSRRKRCLRRGPGGLRGRRMGPHDHWYQQWHWSSRLQHGPGGSDALTRWMKGRYFCMSWHWMAANPQINSRHELNGSDEGGP